MPDGASGTTETDRRTASLNRVWGGIIVEELVRCGAGVFCLSPGSRCTPLTLGVAANPRARSVVHFDERGAAYHALGWAKASGRPAVLICTSGTAAANYFPAVVEASQSEVPLIVLTADRPPELLDAGANQAIDQMKMFGDYVRWHCTLPCPDESVPPSFVLTTVDQAVHRSTCSPAGPVHLNCMFREPFVPAEAPWNPQKYLQPIRRWRKAGSAYTRYAKAEQRPDAMTLALIVEMVRAARRGLLVVGELRSSAECRAVKTLARALKWPAFPDVASGLRLGNDRAPFVSYYDQMLLSPSLDSGGGPDVVLQIGTPFTSKRLMQYLAAASPDAYVLVAGHPLRHDPLHRVTLRVQADIESFCREASERLVTPRPKSAWMECQCKTSKVVHDEVEAFLARDDRLSEPQAARLISKHAPESSVVFLGNSMPMRDMDMYGSPLGASVRVAVNRGASGIDGNIAAAAGYAASLGVTVTALLGDLAALHDLNSLALLSQGITEPVVLVVINNNGGGIFSFLPIAGVKEHFERYFAAPHNLSFEHVAAQFGLEYACPTTGRAFIKAYQKALRGPRHSIIEIRTDRDENLRLHLALQETIARRLESGVVR